MAVVLIVGGYVGLVLEFGWKGAIAAALHLAVLVWGLTRR